MCDERRSKLIRRLLCDVCLRTGCARPSFASFVSRIGGLWRPGQPAGAELVRALQSRPRACLVTGRRAGPGPFSRLVDGLTLVTYYVDPVARPPLSGHRRIERFIRARLSGARFDPAILSRDP